MHKTEYNHNIYIVVILFICCNRFLVYALASNLFLILAKVLDCRSGRALCPQAREQRLGLLTVLRCTDIVHNKQLSRVKRDNN